MNKEQREELKQKLERKIRTAQQQLDMLYALDCYEAFGQPYPPVGKIKKEEKK
jgi:hypothetical protein